jgi:hypothetical protein
MRRSQDPLLLTLLLAAMPGVAAAQSLIFEGLVHSPLGDATLSINSQHQLVVGNIGTRNGDGVSIELGRANSFDMDVLPWPAGLPAGASFEFFADGSVASVPDLRVADIRATRTSSQLRFDASFPAYGAVPKTVEVYFEGVLITSVPGVSVSQVATLPADAWPTRYGVRRHILPQSRPALVCQWSGPVPITLPGGMIVSGNELRVIGMTPSDNMDFAIRTGGSGSDGPDVFIPGEEMEPECPGDVNGDGIVDLNDLAILLGNFGLAGNVSLMDGDLNRDEVVNLADLSELLSNFGNSCD